MIKGAGFFAAAFLGGATAAAAGVGPFDDGGLLGEGARQAGMAGAVVAGEDDAGGIWWNPATLGVRPGYQAQAGYGDLLGEARFDSGISASGCLEPGALDLGTGFRHLAGPGDAYGDEVALGTAFVLDGEEGLLGGISFKEMAGSQAGDSGAGLGLDLGARWRGAFHEDALTLGAVVRSLDSGIGWTFGAFPPPERVYQAGAAYDTEHFGRVEFDSEFVQSPTCASADASGFKAGLERWWSLPEHGRCVALRLGYVQSSSWVPTSLGGVLTAGLGARWRGLNLDYALSGYAPGQGVSQRMTLGWSFAPPRQLPLPPLVTLPSPSPSPTPIASPSPTPFASASPVPSASPSPPFLPSPSPAPSPTAAAAGVSGTRLELIAAAARFAPIPSSTRPRLELKVAYNGTDAPPWRWTARIRGASADLRTVVGKRLPGRIVWNGMDQGRKRVPDGAYDLRLEAYAGGRTLTAKTTVRIDTRRALPSLEAEPRIFKAGVPGQSVALKLSAPGSSASSRWKVQVRSMEEGFSRVFGGSGVPPAVLSWNGSDDGGKPAPGGRLYSVKLSVETASGALAESPELRLSALAVDPDRPLRLPLKTVAFAVGDERLSPESLAAVRESAAAVLKGGKDYQVSVLGRTEPGEQGGAGGTDDISLSFLRAAAVREALIAEGLEPARVAASGAGATQGPGRAADLVLFTR
jgi:hypothetical protein